jgi:hypothetical protein
MTGNFSKMLKGGKEADSDMQKRYGDSIRKEIDNAMRINYITHLEVK